MENYRVVEMAERDNGSKLYYAQVLLDNHEWYYIICPSYLSMSNGSKHRYTKAGTQILKTILISHERMERLKIEEAPSYPHFLGRSKRFINMVVKFQQEQDKKRQILVNRFVN